MKVNSKEVSPEVNTTADTDKSTTTTEDTLKTLMSRVSHPVVVRYNNEDMVVSPRAVINNVNPNLLGDLPAGIVLV